jgi:tRNA 2-thiouridine synthesizing protein A
LVRRTALRKRPSAWNEQEKMTADEILDLRGLKCPLPALMTRRALARLTPGNYLTVLASDPLSVVDIPHMCAEEGHTVDEVTDAPSHAVFRIRRGP